MSARWRLWETAPRLLPLWGILIGAVGGAVYWLGAQLWPTSIAVVLSMLATAGLAARHRSAADADWGVAGTVFALLIKYDALMALSAANLPFALPANLALGLIMIAGHASSLALAASVPVAPAVAGSKIASHGDLGVAFGIGFAPAVLIGIPGLTGLAAAIVARIALVGYLRRGALPAVPAAAPEMTAHLTEICFYLGAVAARAYV